MLTDRYLDGIPEGSRASAGQVAGPGLPQRREPRPHPGLNDIARERGQTLAQMAIAWVLRDARVTSALIGASPVRQLEENLGALDQLDFSDEELAAIEPHAVDAGVDLWRAPATA